jgi:hypothetical protein
MDLKCFACADAFLSKREALEVVDAVAVEQGGMGGVDLEGLLDSLSWRYETMGSNRNGRDLMCPACAHCSGLTQDD